MADVLFHPEAREEYEEAISWYQTRSSQAAVRFEAEVERVLAIIEAHPALFAKYDDEHRFAVVRRFPYSIVYQFEADRVYVVAIAHGSRLPGYWEERA